MSTKIWIAADTDGQLAIYISDKPPFLKEDEDIHSYFPSDGCFDEYDGPIEPPPGECWECHVVPVKEAGAKDARIAELESQLAAADRELNAAVEHHAHWTKKIVAALPEYARYSGDLLHNVLCAIEEIKKQLAERAPGVMPECMAKLIKWGHQFMLSEDRVYLLGPVEAHYATPDGHRWEPVDDANPITADDVGRKVASRCGGSLLIDEWRAGCCVAGDLLFRPDGKVYGKCTCPHDITHILRPIAPPFVFAGEPGRYRTDDGEEVDVDLTKGGRLIVFRKSGKLCSMMNSDGTFPGGRIVGRVDA